MGRRDAIISRLKEVGGWPYGVDVIYSDSESRVFFDGVIIPNFIQKQSISPLEYINGAELRIKVSDYIGEI